MANYQLEQTGAEVQALLNAVESPDTTPAAGSSNLITSGAVQAAVAGVSAEVTALGHKLYAFLYQQIDGINIGGSGGVGGSSWSSNADYSCSIYRVNPGDVVAITAVSAYNAVYSFLTAVDTGQAPQFAGGASATSYLSAGNSVTAIAPSDANYLYITNGAGVDRTPASATINGVPYNAKINELFPSVLSKNQVQDAGLHNLELAAGFAGLVWIAGEKYDSTGKIATASAESRTDKMRLSPDKIIRITFSGTTTTENFVYFYAADGSFISRYIWIDGDVFPPQNAAYWAIVCRTTALSQLTIKEYTLDSIAGIVLPKTLSLNGNHYSISLSNAFETGDYKQSTLIPVTPGDAIEITNNAVQMRYSVLKTLPNLLSTPDFATGWSLKHKTGTDTFNIPSDGAYLYLTLFDAVSPYRFPQTIKINGIDWTATLADRVGAIEQRMNTIPKADAFVVSIADKLYAVVGDTLQIFYKSIFAVENLEDYEIHITGTKGKTFPRYWEYTPAAGDIGTSSLTFELRRFVDADKTTAETIASKSVDLVTIAKRTAAAANRNVLCVGDSTTEGGTWVKEAARRFGSNSGTPQGLGLTNIKFVGSMTGTIDGITCGWEGHGGWDYNAYANPVGRRDVRFTVSGVSSIALGSKYAVEGITYTCVEVNITGGSGTILMKDEAQVVNPRTPSSPTGTLTKSTGDGDATIAYSAFIVESASPFIVNGALDFEDYADTYCDGAIDMLVISLGINNSFNVISNKTTYLNNIWTWMKPFIEKYHEQFPSGKVCLMTICAGSFNGGFSTYGNADLTPKEYQRNLCVLNAFLQETAKDASYSSYVEVIPVAEEFDADYAYPSTNKPVNTRSSVEERIDTNAVHPANDGYYQMADAVYRFLNK